MEGEESDKERKGSSEWKDGVGSVGNRDRILWVGVVGSVDGRDCGRVPVGISGVKVSHHYWAQGLTLSNPMSKAVSKSKERGEERNPAKDSYETDEKSASTKDHFCREGHEVDFLLLFDLYIGGGAGPERPDDREQDQCLRQIEISQTRLALEKKLHSIE